MVMAVVAVLLAAAALGLSGAVGGLGEGQGQEADGQEDQGLVHRRTGCLLGLSEGLLCDENDDFEVTGHQTSSF